MLKPCALNYLDEIEGIRSQLQTNGFNDTRKFIMKEVLRAVRHIDIVFSLAPQRKILDGSLGFASGVS